MKFNRRFVGIATATALATSALVAPNAVAEETPAADTNQSSISTGSDLSSKLGSSLDAGAQLSCQDHYLDWCNHLSYQRTIRRHFYPGPEQVVALEHH